MATQATTTATKPKETDEVKAGLGEGDHFLTLATVQGGYCEALFKHEMKRVLENIADPNTDVSTARVFTLKLAFKPNDERRECALVITATTKLASVKKRATSIFTGRHKGQLIAVESDPQQRGLFDNTPDIAPVAAQKGA